MEKYLLDKNGNFYINLEPDEEEDKINFVRLLQMAIGLEKLFEKVDIIKLKNTEIHTKNVIHEISDTIKYIDETIDYDSYIELRKLLIWYCSHMRTPHFMYGLFGVHVNLNKSIFLYSLYQNVNEINKLKQFCFCKINNMKNKK
jgi:hypothetical protein